MTHTIFQIVILFIDKTIHIVLSCFPYLIYTMLHLVGKPYELNFVANLMILAQTVRPLWLLQGEGGALDIWPLIFTGCFRFRTTLFTLFVGENISGKTCMIFTKYNNHVRIVILFGQWPWVLTSDLDKKKINYFPDLR